MRRRKQNKEPGMEVLFLTWMVVFGIILLGPFLRAMFPATFPL